MHDCDPDQAARRDRRAEGRDAPILEETAPKGGPRALGSSSAADLASRFGALASETRIAILDQLREPRFVRDLANEFGMTRPGILKHLEALEAVGLVHKLQARRGVLPAACFVADPFALFALKEHVWDIASAPAIEPLLHYPTEVSTTRPVADGAATGFLVVRGDALGRRFPLEGRKEWVIGRDEECQITIPNDPYVSSRHAVVAQADDAWEVQDLGSTNGTRLNFGAVPPRQPVTLRPGHVLQIGRTHLVFQG